MSENKAKAVRWLEEFTRERAETCTPNSLTKMVADLNIEPDEAKELLVECEDRLVDMFLEWYNEVTEVEPKSLSLTGEEIFALGNAYGSFSVGQIDQGIHLVLPCTHEDGILENEIFETLFTEYFDKIPDDLPPEKVGEIYFGAIAAFCKDNHLDLFDTTFSTSFEEVKEA